MVQSLFSFATGGVFGTGLGNGQPGTIPAASTDFIIAAIGEELGLVGLAGVLMAQSETPPADLVDVFLEYRGTTAAGLSAMIEADIASPIFRGLSAARRRAEEGLL